MAQPALAEVRVSCPTCGGAIHPIAGRCKHCKTDLVIVRGGATAAIGSVIQLGALAAAPSGPQPGLPSGPSAVAAALAAGAPVAQVPAIGLPAAAAPDAPMVTITAAAPRAPRRSGWRKRWPLLVAAIAGLAIIASVAVLVFGDDDGKHPKRRRALGPAPDRMQTDQLPDDPRRDPRDPDQQQAVPYILVFDIAPGGGAVPDPDSVDPDDPIAPTLPRVPSPQQPPQLPPPSGGAATGPITTEGEFVERLLTASCERLATCWGSPQAADTCSQLRGVLGNALGQSAGCTQFDPAAAGQCVSQLARIPCPDSDLRPDELVGMMAGLDACMRACQ